MLNRSLFAVVVSVVIGILAGNSSAQICPGAAGCLDTTFNGTGKQYIPVVGSYQTDAVVQSDGKVVSLIYAPGGETLIRLNTDGSLDTSFAGDGIVETNWHYNPTVPRGYPYGLAIQVINGEERFVVAGSWSVPAGRNTYYTYLRVDRYLSNGAADTSFGTAGTGTVIVQKPYALAVAIQPVDNKIITVGDGQAVVRLNENGTVDTGFGQNGDGATGAGQAGWSIKGLTDGSIIIGGTYSQSGSGGGDLMCVTRLNYNGSVYTSFGNAGRAVANFLGRGSFGRAFRIDLDPFGHIIAGGIARAKNASLNENKFAAARFNMNGQLDTTFNNTGMVTYDFAGLNNNGRSIVAQADGKLIVTGAAQISSTDSADFGLVRFNYDGTLDTTFGNSGSVTTNIDREDYSNAARIWIDPSCACEKVVMAGVSHSGDSFARYTTQ
jgi:uncharacterized delta-60 repeat protein